MQEPIALQKIITGIAPWIGAFCILAIYTFLYKENPIYRAAEHLYLGLAVGYGLFLTWTQILVPKWLTPMIDGHVWPWAFALVGGAMFYFIYSAKHNWISRLAFGAIMGITVGGMFQDFANNNFPKIAATISKPLIPHDGVTVSDSVAKSIAPYTPYSEVTWPDAINNIIFLLVLLTVMSYFFFSFDYQKRKTIGRVANVGRWVLMIAFGAMFGATVMGRMALLIGRLSYLLDDVFKVTR